MKRAPQLQEPMRQVALADVGKLRAILEERMMYGFKWGLTLAAIGAIIFVMGVVAKDEYLNIAAMLLGIFLMGAGFAFVDIAFDFWRKLRVFDQGEDPDG